MPSYQSAKQSNGKRINTSETVEYALSKGKATEIDTSNSAQSHSRINNNHCCNNNNNTFGVNSQQSADSNVKGYTNKMSSEQNNRDRLGFWGHDSEVAGAVSGLDRLRLSRFNKVCKTFMELLHYINLINYYYYYRLYLLRISPNCKEFSFIKLNCANIKIVAK